jgi:ATP-binding cassette subfamily B protein
LRFGRNLELRYRLAFFEKLPKVGDKYFASRLLADVAERSHSIRHLRNVPDLGFRYVGALAHLTFMTAGIVYLDPASTLPALLLLLSAIALPVVTQRLQSERDLTVRTHTGALSQVYLDALRGLVPIRAHAAEAAMLRLHEERLVNWMTASLRLLRTVVLSEASVTSITFGLAVWLVIGHMVRTGISGGTLLLVYWALSMPDLGQQLGVIVRQYPMLRSVLLRLAEPLTVPEEPRSHETRRPVGSSAEPVSVRMTGVQVVAGGHVLLDDVNLSIAARTHVAIVGASGAGKSTLVGTCLGWYKPAKGVVEINGKRLDDAGLCSLRLQTVWLDPSSQIWNRSLLDNLRYGARGAVVSPDVQLDLTDLKPLLKSLQNGLCTSLGENGAFVSGGEGQRIRIARALNRPNANLVIIDEAFRGLDPDQRRRLLRMVRNYWADATLLCVTHDVAATTDFDHVVIVRDGLIAEQGTPDALLASPLSLYNWLMQTASVFEAAAFQSDRWRRFVLENGQLVRSPP